MSDWKTRVTVPWPEFRVRNALSNFWANYLAAKGK